MSSTRHPASEAALVAFLEAATEAGRQLRERDPQFFDRPPQKEAGSFFIRRAPTSASREVLEGPSCVTAAELERKLAALWSASSAPELARLAPAAAALAEALRGERHAKGDDGDVTPFIYAMF